MICEYAVALQVSEYAKQASRMVATDLEQLTVQVAHLQGLNGTAADKYNEMADFGRGMSVFLEVGTGSIHAVFDAL